MAMIEQATAGTPERAAFRERVGALNPAPSREQQSGPVASTATTNYVSCEARVPEGPGDFHLRR
jgi:hypothetical protein